MSTRIAFADPAWLLLLLLLPGFWWISRRYAVGLSPLRAWLALLLRGLGLACLAMALAGFTLLRTRDDLAVLFLVDGSDSVPAVAREHALDYAREAVKSMRPQDRAGIIVFGRDALVESAPRPGLEIPPKLTSVVDRTASDLAGAMRVAAGVFPSDSKKRVVVLSDGLQTRGSLEDESLAASAQRIQIDYLPLARREGAEVLVERVQAPSRVAQNEAFDVQAVLRPFDDTTGTVRLFRDGQLVAEQAVELKAGKPKVVDFPQKLEKGGFFTWEAVIEPAKDTIAQNNSAIAYTRIEGTPRVLIASSAKSHGKYLESALEAGGFDVIVAGPEALSSSLADLAAYDAVVLDNVAATDLTRGQMETLRSFARDFGGGLVAVGGDQSFGVGGWDDTPLEEVMPVDMTMKDTEQHPAVCLEIVIDKSGSMEGTDASGVSKIQMAKEAAIGAVELLSARDSVGVIAFDSASQVVLPATKLKNRGAVIDAIGSIGGGGGTDFFPALEDGRKEAVASGAAVKHVLLISDGQSAPGDIAGMMSRYNADKVTLSTIGVGGDTDQNTMGDLAKRGGGRFYYSPDAESLPRIFSRETILVSRNYIIEEPFTPGIVTGGGMIRGFESIAIPRLHGYIGTTKKQQATLWLQTAKGDPLLASWRVGLGKAVAWTSDAEPRWSREWVDWEGYPKFWTQVVRSSLGAREGTGLSANASIDADGVMRIEAEATDTGGEFANFKDVRAEVVGPDRNRVEVPLRQTGPGRYAAVTRAEKVGAYLVTVAMTGGKAGAEELVGRAVAGASISYSPEYRVSSGDGGLLARVSQRTGGVALAAPAEAFRPPEAPARVPREVTALLLWLAASLFLLDVAVRRVIIGRESFDRLGARIRGIFSPVHVPASSHVAGLAAAAKRGVPETPRMPARPRVPGTSVPAPTTPAAAGPAPDARPVIKPAAPPRTNPDAPPPAGTVAGGNLAGSLLDRVKKKRDS